MTEKELLFLALKGVGIDEQEAETLYSDGTTLKGDAKTVIESKLKARADKIKADLTAKYNAGHQAAKAEVLTTYEEGLKAKYAVDGDFTGQELIDKIIAAQSKVDEATIKAHPSYIKIANELKEVGPKAKKLDAVQAELTVIKSKVTKQSLAQAANDELDALNLSFSSDAKKAAKQKQDFIEVLMQNGVKIDDAGNPIPCGSDGNPLADAHGNEVTFKQFVKQLAEERFDYNKAPAKAAAGGAGASGAAAAAATFKGVTLTKSKTEAEYYSQKENIENNTEMTKVEKHAALLRLTELGIETQV